MQVDIFAPIVPAVGLGGIALRQRLFDIQGTLVGLGVSKRGWCSMVGPFEARYYLGEGVVSFSVDVRNGKIFRVSAHPGYKGKLANGLWIGMPVQEAVELQPDIFYSEVDQTLLSSLHPGVAIDVDNIDPSPEEVLSMEIQAISVYVPELDTPAGQRGDW